MKYWILPGVCLFSVITQAASFDCKKASTVVEQLICNDETLGKLDEQLSETYKSLLQTTNDRPVLITTQQDWLTARNQCKTPECVEQSYHNRLSQFAVMPRKGWKHYINRTLKVSFDYPGHFNVKPCAEGFGKNCIAIVDKPQNMYDSDYVIAFNVVKGGLEENATNEALFEETDGKWMTTAGPGVPQEVQTFSGNNWTGMKAVQTCGISDKETGFHAAGGECFWAVISNGHASVVAHTQGIIGNDPETFHIIETLKFL